MYLLYGFVDSNKLSGTIPTEFGRMASLDFFYLCKSVTMSSSELETITLFGSIPYLTMCLLHGFVDGNQLTGPIPTELVRLASLDSFYLCKSGTTSSSELKTMTLFGSVLQFISSTAL
jgi:hypothetical protein